METGRPTKYKEEFNEQAYKLCLLGATDSKIAEFFEICEATLNNWKIEYPLFLESIKKGKEIADAEVAQSLFGRARGYDRGSSHYPADTTAAIFWLKNRQPKQWRDKQEIDQRNVNLTASDLTPEEIKAISQALDQDV